ncbi:hypothetical protein [Actinopolymorpha pittospori]
MATSVTITLTRPPRIAALSAALTLAAGEADPSRDSQVVVG